MCSVCNSFKCHPSCPGAPEPKRFGVCKICKEDIVEGEEMVEIEGREYHYECLEVGHFLEMLDIPIKVAGDDLYD